ncbi:MAG: 3D domain-containing protein [Caulobacteraceae bacterium]|nr:3D domain-containing protein [Caulobacteraceae bacterium]
MAIPATAMSAEPVRPGYDPIGDAIAAVDRSVVQTVVEWSLKASLYHGGRKIAAHDSLGCRVAPMRTVAVDPSVVSRHSVIFIKETVGLPLPGGGVHDGYWYASDIGGAIKGARIDLFTGLGAASMRALSALNMKSLTVTKVGEFTGCPPTDGGEGAKIADAR